MILGFLEQFSKTKKEKIRYIFLGASDTCGHKQNTILHLQLNSIGLGPLSLKKIPIGDLSERYESLVTNS